MSLSWGVRERTWSRELPSGPDAATAARWFLVDALRGQDEPVDLYTAALLTTEVASNAARYGQEPIELSFTLQEEKLRVSVLDRGAGFDPEDETLRGFGTRLIQQLSSDWGADRSEEGTEVWFKI